MLPVSGAEQLNTSDAKPTLPISSAQTAYSRLVRPAPLYGLSAGTESSGRNRFHSPAAFALALSSSTTGTTCQRFSPKACICAA
jgi:hypothetical protein